MYFRFERFEAWKRAVDFADQILAFSEGLPYQLQRSLGEQLRRAALSVPTNLAEGSGRDSPKEERYFYGVAKGSLYEVVSLLVIAGKRGHLSRDRYRELYDEANQLAAMISGAIQARAPTTSFSSRLRRARLQRGKTYKGSKASARSIISLARASSPRCAHMAARLL